jgi:hypothetical protein
MRAGRFPFAMRQAGNPASDEPTQRPPGRAPDPGHRAVVPVRTSNANRAFPGTRLECG